MHQCLVCPQGGRDGSHPISLLEGSGSVLLHPPLAGDVIPIGGRGGINRSVLAALLLTMLAATGCSAGDDTTPDGRAPPAVASTGEQGPESTEVTRTLDFDAPRRRGELVARVSYGDAPSQVGFVPVCTEKCSPPCPCTAPIQPVAADVDDAGRVWVADTAKSRLAVFEPTSELSFATARSALLFSASDLQVTGGQGIVLSQDNRHRARVLSFDEAGEESRSTLSFEGGTAEAYQLWTHGTRLFSTVFRTDGLTDEEVPVEVTLEDGEAAAVEVPGRPFLDGWSLFHDYAGDQTVALEVSASSARWRVEINLELRQSVEGRSAPRRGHVSWESEIAPDGTFHLLLLAGTEGRLATDGYWYLAVAPDGAVGPVLPLQGPSVRDDQQSRRLSLDAEGDPVLMWAGRRALRFERPPST